MQPSEFLSAVETLLKSHNIPQNCHLVLVVHNFQLDALKRKTVLPTDHVLCEVSKAQRKCGLSSNYWQKIFNEMLKAYDKGILK